MIIGITIFVIALVCPFIYPKYNNKIQKTIILFGLLLLSLLFIILFENNLTFIPRETLIKYDTIAPIIHNELNDNEILYSYNDDEYCYYYIESSNYIKGKLIFDEVKIPLENIIFDLDDNEYPIAKITYTDFTPVWKFIIGRSNPIIIDCKINR